VLLGWIAAFSKLELATAVLVLPQRQTALAAKQAVEVDILTHGHFRLGVGIGWNFVEFEALGQRFTNRGRRIEEQIALMRRLWTEQVVDLTGRWHRVDRAGLNPLPVQRPIPVWMGGNADPALERIARIADGYFTQLQPNEAGLAQLERFRGDLREAGRDVASFPIEGRVTVARLAGPEDWVRTAEAFRDLGFTHLEINTMGAKLASVDDHIAALRRFREDAKALFS
jgi:probable F420-dependent oxidoreductase